MSVSPLALITLNRAGATVPPSIASRRYEFSERDSVDKVVRAPQRFAKHLQTRSALMQLKQNRSQLKVEFPISFTDARTFTLCSSTKAFRTALFPASTRIFLYELWEFIRA